MSGRRGERTLETLVSEQRARDDALPAFLRARKLARMRRSPHAFLRGTARLFYALVRERNSTARVEGRGASEGFLCGDLHVENFGAFRTDEQRHGRSRVVFDVNDFDDAVEGPLCLDLLRLTTSLLLATRGARPDAHDRLKLARSMLHAYDDAMAQGAMSRTTPRFVLQLLGRTSKRRGRQLVAERTEGTSRALHFVRGDRYRALSASERRAAIDAFVQYAERTLRPRGAKSEEYEIIDVAYRVAGTGSLGAFRIAVLTRGRKARAPWLFDMKEQLRAPSPTEFAPLSVSLRKLAPAERVVRAERALLSALPAALGVTEFDGRSMLVRRLSPQEDKLSLDQVAPSELDALVPYLGAVVGCMHAGSRTKARGRRAPSQTAREALLEEAAVLAGLHETAHLLYMTEPR